MNTRHLILPVALALALAAPRVEALGLGQLQVKSGLNQPLLAEIPIIAASPGELDQLSVSLASPDAFARVGLERPVGLAANLQFSVGKNARGQPVVLVTTTNKFVEPVLSFLIVADWDKGSMTREYTALIDPPYIAAAVIHPMQAPASASTPTPMQAAPLPMSPAVAAPPEPSPAQTLAASEPEPAVVEHAAPPPVAPPPPPHPLAQAPAPAQVAPEPPPQPAPEPAPAPAVQAGHYGPVGQGQTLSAIALSVRPDRSVSVNQMMIALLRANPEAFIQDNINQLKRGAVLRIPAEDEVARLSSADAAVLVHQQISAWRAPRQPIPQPAESLAEPAVATTAKAKPAAPAAAKPATTPAPSRVAGTVPGKSARLEIVPPSGKTAASGAQSGAAAGAGGAELRAELVHAREELAVRTSEVTDLKSRIADLQHIDEQRQKMIAVQNSEMKALQDRLKQLEDEKTAAAATPAPAPATALTAMASGTAQTPPPATAAATTAAQAAKAATPSPNTVAVPWYLNPYLLGGGVLVLLGGLVLAMRGSKSKSASGEFAPRRISEDEALRASLASVRHEPVIPAVLDPEADLPIPTLSAAPAQAAPVDARLQALHDAISARPRDLEAHLNLLRYHHAHGDAKAYEAAAQAMRAQVDSTLDPRWREAVVLGAALMPGNALFGQLGWNTPRFSDHPLAAHETVAPPVESRIEPEPRAEAAWAAQDSDTLEPMTDSSDPELAWTDEETVDPADAEHAGDAREPDEYLAAVDHAAAPPSSVVSDDQAESVGEDEASATRIELAKAYLDIGDLDGAHSMLEDVLAEGSPAARAEAERILKEIG